MANISEKDFLENLIKEQGTSHPLDIQSLDEINLKLKGLLPDFTKRGILPKEFTVLGVSSVLDFEGIVKVATIDMIPPGEKVLARRRQYIVVSDELPTVIAPIVIKSGNQIFILLCAQNRLTLGGRVSIEVYRGSAKEGTETSRLALTLMERKLPDLQHSAKLLEVRDLGYFWNNTGTSSTTTPIQALFYVTDEAMPEQEFKKAIKPEYGAEPDPKKGPVLHNTEPVLRTLKEIQVRLDEIQHLNLTDERLEAYLNDMFSITALNMLFNSIDKQGMPY